MSEHPAITSARLWIGTPYQHQAALRGIGCDCLGLLRGVWRDLYGAEPEEPGAYDASRFRSGARETLLEAAERHLVLKTTQLVAPGDVLLFRLHPMRPVQHCGIAVDARTMIHAHDGACVCETELAPWMRRLAYVFSFPAQG